MRRATSLTIVTMSSLIISLQSHASEEQQRGEMTGPDQIRITTGFATVGPSAGARAGKPERPRYQPQTAQPAAQAQRDHDNVGDQQAAYDPQPKPTKAQITGQAQVSEPGAESPIPGTYDAQGHYLGPWASDETGYGAKLEARSRRIFPDVGHEAERQKWMAAQEQRAIENEINRRNALVYPVGSRR